MRDGFNSREEDRLRTAEQTQSMYRDLTTAEFGARIGGVTAAHVRELIDAGRIPEAINISPHKERSEWRIPEAAVERFRTENSAGFKKAS